MRCAGIAHRKITFNSFAIAIPPANNPRSSSTGVWQMRLSIIPPAELNAEQKPLYDDMRDGIARNFQGFINIRDDGALLGPWNPWIHEPTFGKPVWGLTKAMVSNPSLPANVREVAILVTGAHFKSAYELYAHVTRMATSLTLAGSDGYETIALV